MKIENKSFDRDSNNSLGSHIIINNINVYSWMLVKIKKVKKGKWMIYILLDSAWPPGSWRARGLPTGSWRAIGLGMLSGKLLPIVRPVEPQTASNLKK